MDEQAQGAILVVGGSGRHIGSGIGDCYHPFLIKTLGAWFHRDGDICTLCGVGAPLAAPFLPGRASPAPTSRESRNDRQDACPTGSAELLRPASPMPLDRMWIGLEIITQMGLLVNNTAS